MIKSTNNLTFQGFFPDTKIFLEGLDSNNNKEWFHSHKVQYEQFVKTPLTQLANELTFEFGSPHIYRPNRDVRFSKDKKPYKTNASFFVNSSIGGYYFEINSSRAMLAGGLYEPQSDQLLRFREIFDSKNKPILKKLITHLENLGYSFWEENKLKTAPRGWKLDHDEIEYLRLRHIVVSKNIDFRDCCDSKFLQKIRTSFGEIKKLNELLIEFVGESKIPKKTK